MIHKLKRKKRIVVGTILFYQLKTKTKKPSGSVLMTIYEFKNNGSSIKYFSHHRYPIILVYNN